MLQIIQQELYAVTLATQTETVLFVYLIEICRFKTLPPWLPGYNV